MEEGVLTKTIFDYCKIKKITLDEFVKQVKEYSSHKTHNTKGKG